MNEFLKMISPEDQETFWGIATVGLGVSVLAFFLARKAFALSKPSLEMVSGSTTEKPETDPFEVGSSAEKRSAARRKGGAVEVSVHFKERIQPPILGCVVDRSIGGLRLEVPCEVPVGTILQVRPREAPPGAPWIEIEVKSCSQHKNAWHVGCAYLKTPSWSVLLLFG